MDGRRIMVSQHAVDRWRERVCPDATTAEIVAVLTGPAFHTAADFGARVVRIGRHRVLLEHTPLGVAILTVLDVDFLLPTQLLPAARGGPMPIAHQRALYPQTVGEPL